jgi:phosphatidylserine/phosphatidylglycerophosphate/cardiolipin synthase-like enzyme
MPRRPATVTEADIRRIIRAAKAEGVAVDVVIRGNGEPVIVHVNTAKANDKNATTGHDKSLEGRREIVL